jgi:nitrate/nitrite transport system substrate-binding protein
MAEPATTRMGRRRFLGLTAAGLGSSLLAGCGDTEPRAATTTPATPSTRETFDIRFGIIALTDCSPIVIAHEKGFFQKYGVNATVNKLANWAAIRDALSNGDIQSTHMLFGMPIASSMGLLGSPVLPMVIPWMLNRNGQSITLKAALRGRVAADPQALRPVVMAAKDAGRQMTFAMTFPPGTHAMWMRYYLAAGGINPDHDVRLITIPPAQMVANMGVGQMDGYCVGEPWNARAVAEGIGFTALNTQDMWRDHPEKVCAFKKDYADANPRAVKAVLKALHEASVWLDDMANRPEQAAIVSRPAYINCPPDLILGRMQGHYDFGDGRQRDDPNYMIFSQRNCNYPQKKYVIWWLSQFRRWGMVDSPPDYQGIADRVIRADLYEEAMRELGVSHDGPSMEPETLFDNVTFDPRRPEEYARAFAVHNLRG